MIHSLPGSGFFKDSKPRASGDDPHQRVQTGFFAG